MKKWIVLLVVVAAIAGVWYYLRNRAPYTPIWFQPKTGKVTRGDIKVPITASGLIEPNQRIEVKSMASGRIIEVPVAEGDFVKKGDVVVRLDPIDEERSRDRAKADLDRAKAMLKQAEVAIDRAAVSIETAQARLQEIEAQLDYAKYQLEQSKNFRERGSGSETEVKERDSQVRTLQAQRDSAEIGIRAAGLAKEDAQAAVASQTAIVASAGKTFADAEKRLKETTVLAPDSAIVTNVPVRPGMLVQSAVESFMGGTLLMTIADVSQKKVVARLDEADYGRVTKISPVDALPDMPELRDAARQDAEAIAARSGRVKVTSDAFPDEEFEGVIERVEPQGKLNPGSAIIQFDVHVQITGASGNKLPLGAQAQVEFTVQSANDVIRVPSDAVKNNQGQRGVYLQVPPEPGSNEQWGKKFVICRFGITDGSYTQVLSTQGETELADGMTVYTKLPVDREKLEQ